MEKNGKGQIKSIEEKQARSSGLVYFKLNIEEENGNTKIYNLFSEEKRKGLNQGDYIEFSYAEKEIETSRGRFIVKNITELNKLESPPTAFVSRSELDKDRLEFNKKKNETMIRLGCLRDAITYFQIKLENDKSLGKKPEGFNINMALKVAEKFEKVILNGWDYEPDIDLVPEEVN
jgi:hypothetical protein